MKQISAKFQETVENIDNARDVMDLSMEDFHKIFPEVEKRVEEVSKTGVFNFDDYLAKFGSLKVV